MWKRILQISGIKKGNRDVMKRKLLSITLLTIICMSTSACNRQIIDTTYSYEKAIISLPNGEIIEGNVQSWKDYEDGDQIQVKIDGKQYLVHSSNIALISE